MLKKKIILDFLSRKLDDRIVEAKGNLAELKENRDSETKSSMGDKYETGRSLMEMEMSKLNAQLLHYVQQKRAISQIDPKLQYEMVDVGSLVNTNIGLFFISIPFGRIDINGEKVMCISSASPLGKVLQKQKCDNKFVFQGNEIIIKKVF